MFGTLFAKVSEKLRPISAARAALEPPQSRRVRVISGAACDQAGNTTKAFAQVRITSKVNRSRMASLLEVIAQPAPAPGDRSRAGQDVQRPALFVTEAASRRHRHCIPVRLSFIFGRDENRDIVRCRSWAGYTINMFEF